MTNDELCALSDRVGRELAEKRAEEERRTSAIWRERERKRLALQHAAPKMRDVLRGLLEWYAALPNPGDVPDALTLSARLREARDAVAEADAVVVPGVMGATEDVSNG